MLYRPTVFVFSRKTNDIAKAIVIRKTKEKTLQAYWENDAHNEYEMNCNLARIEYAWIKLAEYAAAQTPIIKKAFPSINAKLLNV